MSKPFLSGSGKILSLHRPDDPLLRPGEAKAHRVRGRVEHDGDLARLELLPGPEPHQLAIRLVEFSQRSFELRVVELGGGWVRGEGICRSTIDHPSDQPQSLQELPLEGLLVQLVLYLPVMALMLVIWLGMT